MALIDLISSTPHKEAFDLPCEVPGHTGAMARQFFQIRVKAPYGWFQQNKLIPEESAEPAVLNIKACIRCYHEFVRDLSEKAQEMAEMLG